MSDGSAESIIRRVLQALESAEVPYMLTGSFAGAFPRCAADDPRCRHRDRSDSRNLHKLIGQFPEQSYYLSRDAALQAYGSEGLFKNIDFDGG